MPTNLFLDNIEHYKNIGLLEAYYRSNLNLAMGFETSLHTIKKLTEESPFTQDLLTTDNTVEFVSDSDIHTLTEKMILVTSRFIDSSVEALKDCRQTFNTDIRDIKVQVHQGFSDAQTDFYKNLSNYLSFFLYFSDMSVQPAVFFSVFGAQQILSQDVADKFQDGSFQLMEKDLLLKTNLRNMTTFQFKAYIRLWKVLLKAFSSIAMNYEDLMIREIISQHRSIPSNLVDYLEKFSDFPILFKDSIIQYIESLHDYYEIIFTIVDTEGYAVGSILQDQQALENRLYKVITLIADCNFVTSVSINEGGKNHTIGEILEIEPNTDIGHQQNVKVRVTSLISGHIRNAEVQNLDGVGSGNNAENYLVGDTLVIKDDDNTSFTMSVKTIKDGFVETLNSPTSIQTGFEINDSTDSNLTLTHDDDDGTDLQIKVTDVDGKLGDVTLLGSAVKKYVNDDRTITISPETNQDNSANAIVEIKKITPQISDDITITSISPNADLDYDHTLDMNADVTQKINMSLGDSDFSLDIKEMRFDPAKINLSENTKTNSQINDNVVIDNNQNDQTLQVKSITLDGGQITSQIVNKINFDLANGFSNASIQEYLVGYNGNNVKFDVKSIDLNGDQIQAQIVDKIKLDTASIQEYLVGYNGNDVKFDVNSIDLNTTQIQEQILDKISFSGDFSDAEIKDYLVAYNGNNVKFTVPSIRLNFSQIGSQILDKIDFNTENASIQNYDVAYNLIEVENTKLSQVGSDIVGVAGGDNFGQSVSVSSDGKIVAIGAIGNDGKDTNAGHVRVFEYKDDDGNGTFEWTQLGTDIEGQYGADRSGYSVSLSSDGKIVAIGAPKNDGTRTGTNSEANQGHVRIYQFIDGAWKQIGGDINGDKNKDEFGNSVSLSADGLRVAIGGYLNDGSYGTDSGHVRVFEFSNNAWTQLGFDIDGEEGGDSFGSSVSLSADGSIVAIGATENNSGYVMVYRYIDDTWFKLGQVEGEANDDKFGNSVSLSANGSIVAIGAPRNDGGGTDSGHVRVYQMSENDGNFEFTLLGTEIDGQAAGDQFGSSVSLSEDGLLLAIGAPVEDDDNSGKARVYKYEGDNWVLKDTFDGKTGNGRFGTSVSVSGDGNTVVIGAPHKDNGYVSVYTFPVYYAGDIVRFNVQEITLNKDQIASQILDKIDFSGNFSKAEIKDYLVGYNDNHVKFVVNSINLNESQIDSQILNKIDFSGNFSDAEIKDYLVGYNNNHVKLTVESINLNNTQIKEQIVDKIDFAESFTTSTIQNYDVGYNDNKVRLSVDKIDVQVKDIMDQISVDDTQSGTYTITFNDVEINIVVPQDGNVITKELNAYSFSEFLGDVNNIVDNLNNGNLTDDQKNYLKAWISVTNLYQDENNGEIESDVDFANIDWSDVSATATNFTTELKTQYDVSSPYYIAVVVLLQQMAEKAAEENDDNASAASNNVTITLAEPTSDLNIDDIFEIIRLESGYTGFDIPGDSPVNVTENYSPSGTIVASSKSYVDSNGINVNSTTIASKELGFDFDNLEASNFTTSLDDPHTGTPNDVTKSYVDNSDVVVTSTTVSQIGLTYFFGDLESSNFDIPETPVTHTGTPTVSKSYVDDGGSTVESTTISSTTLNFVFNHESVSNLDLDDFTTNLGTHTGTPTVSKSYLDSNGDELNEVTISSTELDFVFTNTGLDEDDFTTSLDPHSGTPNDVTKSYVTSDGSQTVVVSTTISSATENFVFDNIDPSNFTTSLDTLFGTPNEVDKSYVSSTDSNSLVTTTTISSTTESFVFDNGLDASNFTTSLETLFGTPNEFDKSYSVDSTTISDPNLTFNFTSTGLNEADFTIDLETHTGKATSLKSDDNFVLEIDSITKDNFTNTHTVSTDLASQSLIIDPTGVIESFDTSSVTLTTGGLVSFDDDSIEFQINGGNREDLYVIDFSVTGYLNYNNDNNDYEIINQGSGFNGQENKPVVSSEPTDSNISLSNLEMIEGKIYDVEILNGGRDYNNNNSITLTKDNNDNNAEATFTVSSIKNGIIEEVEISNGGKDFTLDQEITVGDAQDSKTTTILKLTEIDNDHIEEIELVDPGSGFMSADNVSIKDSQNNESIDITTINKYGNTNESILCILDNIDEELEK